MSKKGPQDLFLRCVSDLRCEVGGIGALPLGEKALSIPSLGLFIFECALLCLLSHGVWAQGYTVVGPAFGPTLTVGMPTNGPGDSQVLFSPVHWHRSTEVRSQDCSSHVPGPTVGAMEVAQTLAWPNPVCVCPQSPQLLKPDPSQLQEHLSIWMFSRH